MSRRTPGLRGKQPAKPTNLPHLHTLKKSATPGTSTAVAGTVDVSHGWIDWAGMLGNGPDSTLTLNRGKPVGDCFWAAFERGRITKALVHQNGKWTLPTDFAMPTSDQTVGLYFGWGSKKPPGVCASTGPDKGTNCEEALQWLFEAGLIKRYGPVKLDRALIDEAMVAHKGVIVGVALDQDAEEEFAEHKAWRDFPQTIDPDVGGHAIYKVKRTPTLDTFLTWGEDQKAEDDWSNDHIDEAWWFQLPNEPDADGYEFAKLDHALSHRASENSARFLATAPVAALSLTARVSSFVASVVKAIPAVLLEAAKLKDPVLDAMIVADVAAVLSPLGVNFGTTGPIVTNVLVGLGILANAIEKARATPPAPA
jgi:hypothetical protein